MREFVGEPVDEGYEGRVIGDEALEAPELGAAASDGLGHPRHGPLRLLRREYGAQRRRRPLPRRSHRSPLSASPPLDQKTPLPPGLQPQYGVSPAAALNLLAERVRESFSHHSRGKGRGPATRKAMNLAGPTGGRLPVDGGWDSERWRREKLENEREAAVAEWELRSA